MSRRGHKSNSFNTIVYKQETTAAIKYSSNRPGREIPAVPRPTVPHGHTGAWDLSNHGNETKIHQCCNAFWDCACCQAASFGEGAFCLSIHLSHKKEKDEHLLTSLLPHSSSQRYSSINKRSEDLCIIVCFSLKKVIKSVGLKGSEPEEESGE